MCCGGELLLLLKAYVSDPSFTHVAEVERTGQALPTTDDTHCVAERRNTEDWKMEMETAYQLNTSTLFQFTEAIQALTANNTIRCNAMISSRRTCSVCLDAMLMLCQFAIAIC